MAPDSLKNLGFGEDADTTTSTDAATATSSRSQDSPRTS